MMTERPTRAQVPVDQTWRLEDLYASPADWEAELTAIHADIATVTRYKGSLVDGAATLASALEAQHALLLRLQRAATYAGLRFAEDSTAPANQAATARAHSLAVAVLAALTFIHAEILTIPPAVIASWLDGEPRLTPFRSGLQEILAAAPHMLSQQTEQALSALGEVLSAPVEVYVLAKNADMQFPAITNRDGRELPVSVALYEDMFEQSPDTALRRAAFAAFTEGLGAHQNALGATFAAEVKKNVALARLRGYPCTEAMLLQHPTEPGINRPHQVSLEIYHNVLSVIRTELAPHMRRLANLRKRVLGLDTLYACDIKAPLDAAYKPPVTYGEASDLILSALAVLGPEYGQILKTALTERWVDRADNVGKHDGAFCTDHSGVHPYILMTWTDAMRSAFTLAHELGHAAHAVLAARYQDPMNTWPSPFFVEAPSTLSELLLGQYLLDQPIDGRMRRWVISQLLGTYHHNFITHLLEGELQHRIYALAEEGEAVTAEVLSTVKGEILGEFWGDTVQIDTGARLTWMRQEHYYMGLYPYTYAAGLSAATAVVQLIRSEGRPATERWLQALKAGGSMGPQELMLLAGVDMSNPEPLRQAVAYVGSLVSELEQNFD